MICRTCGYENAPGEAFCGSCGQFLDLANEAAGEPQGTSPSDEETATHPAYGAPGAQSGAQSGDWEEPAEQWPVDQRHARQAPPGAMPPEGPPRMARRAAPGVTYGTIACWNCGRRNQATRTFCQRCGERLSVGSLGYGDMARPASNRAKMFAIGAGVLALLLLAGGAAAFLFGGGPEASPTPTGAAVVSPSPVFVPTLQPTAEPTLEPTLPPTPEPTLEPTAEPTPEPTEEPTTPPATPVSCADSTVPTQWANLSGGDDRARVRREQAWCIHQVVVVPDPNFGEGTIRLLIGNSPLVEVNHGGGSAEYPFNFGPAHLVPPRTDVNYSMTCAGDFCNAVIQVGYELITAP